MPLATLPWAQSPASPWGDRRYPITHLAGSPLYRARALPIVVAPHTLGLDEADTRFAMAGSGNGKKTAFQLAQELLNASPDHQWAIGTTSSAVRPGSTVPSCSTRC